MRVCPVSSRRLLTPSKVSLPLCPSALKQTARHCRRGGSLSMMDAAVPLLFAQPWTGFAARPPSVQSTGSTSIHLIGWPATTLTRSRMVQKSKCGRCNMLRANPGFQFREKGYVPDSGSPHMLWSRFSESGDGQPPECHAADLCRPAGNARGQNAVRTPTIRSKPLEGPAHAPAGFSVAPGDAIRVRRSTRCWGYLSQAHSPFRENGTLLARSLGARQE